MNDLDDLEICKYLADISGVSWMQVYPDSNQEFVGIIDDGVFPELIGRYDPLEKSTQGKALCMDLIEKYKIALTPVSEGLWRATSMCASCTDSDYQRAACLVLFMEKKQQ